MEVPFFRRLDEHFFALQTIFHLPPWAQKAILGIPQSDSFGQPIRSVFCSTPMLIISRLRCMLISTLDVGLPYSGRRIACDLVAHLMQLTDAFGKIFAAADS
jgi:hypothetical protein